MVLIDGLTKRYGTTLAVDHISFDVAAGDILALVGPNGAGKTTALKLMVGLLAPTEGRILIGGHDVQLQPTDAKRLLSFVPDQPFVYESLTIIEFLGFLASVHQMTEAAFWSQTERLLTLFGLWDVRTRRIGHLSYGMKSRVVLVASLLHQPRVLIMDEPFFGLDPGTLAIMKRFLREQRTAGTTILLSTHQLNIVEDLASRVAVIAAGRVRALGTLDELRHQHGGSNLEDLFFQLTGPKIESVST